MDVNNNAITTIMEENWKSWAMVISRCTFKKDMFAKILDNLIPSSFSEGFVPQFRHQVLCVLRIFQYF
jgi:hypothetical protein